MNLQKRVIPLAFALLAVLLAGCSGAVAGLVEVASVEETAVVRQIQYVDDVDEGPVYSVSVDVPDEWVGAFETSLENNRIDFNFINVINDEVETRSTVFSIEALSMEQYWEQVGSYPGDFTNLVFTADTYFVYYLPYFAYYAGLDDETFAEFAEAVPDIVRTISVERVEEF